MRCQGDLPFRKDRGFVARAEFIVGCRFESAGPIRRYLNTRQVPTTPQQPVARCVLRSRIRRTIEGWSILEQILCGRTYPPGSGSGISHDLEQDEKVWRLMLFRCPFDDSLDLIRRFERCWRPASTASTPRSPGKGGDYGVGSRGLNPNFWSSRW